MGGSAAEEQALLSAEHDISDVHIDDITQA
jgi:hypothetical protein